VFSSAQFVRVRGLRRGHTRRFRLQAYRDRFRPVFVSRKIVGPGLLRLKSNMLRSDLAIASIDPLPSRLPLSQRFSMYLITDVWSVTLCSTKLTLASGEIMSNGSRRPYRHRPRLGAPGFAWPHVRLATRFGLTSSRADCDPERESNLVVDRFTIGSIT